MSNILDAISGVTSKTIEEVKPVIDNAVEKANEICGKDMATMLDKVTSKEGPDIENDVSDKAIAEVEKSSNVKATPVASVTKAVEIDTPDVTTPEATDCIELG